MKVFEFFVPWVTKFLGIPHHDDFSYLTLHIKDTEVQKVMRMYRASRFEQLCGIVFVLVTINVIHKFILVFMKSQDGYF